MSKVRLLTVFVAVIVVAAVMLGLFVSSNREGDEALPKPTAMDKTSTGLGITYLPVTPGLSEYYELGVDYGALVTEVSPGSPADRAGLRAGDVIVSFNGARPEEPSPLLGMMMTCPAGNTATLEVWRETGTRMIKVFHRAR